MLIASLSFVLLFGVIHSKHTDSFNGMYACRPSSHTRSMKFCNASLSFTDRVNDLLSRLTFAEKLSLLGFVSSIILCT